MSSTRASDGNGVEVNDLRGTLTAKLAQLRNELLDLSRRNRLLNFRGDKGVSSLRVVDELAPEIFRMLVTERRSFHFLPREEAPTVIGALPSDDDPEAEEDTEIDVGIGLPLAPLPDGGAAARHRDHALQTALAGEALQTRLTRLAQQARSSLQEHGTNILYLTLGMVSWRDTAASDVWSNAPLLLVPVELDRKNVNSRHAVRLLDEDIVANPCLLELAKRVFSASLPVPELTDEFDLPAYLLDVKAVASTLGWRVTHAIHLGLFSFSKLLMYRDLEPDLWPQGASIVDHPMVRRLLGAGDSDVENDVPARDPAELDDAFHPSNVFQVMDADSSQQIAIAAARDGASAVIEGPPGTGKSQTITNVIAECLAQGKRVLFVAEKAAALEVVQRRLESAGLGDFVLELHSRKTSKAAVLAELQRCLAAAQDDAGAPDVDPDELAALRSRANAYVRELHARRSGLESLRLRCDVAPRTIRRDSPERLRRAERPLLVGGHAGRRARAGLAAGCTSGTIGRTNDSPMARGGAHPSWSRRQAKNSVAARPAPRRSGALASGWRPAGAASRSGRLLDHCERSLTSRCGRTRSEAAWPTSCPATGATGAGGPRAVSIPCWRTPKPVRFCGGSGRRYFHPRPSCISGRRSLYAGRKVRGCSDGSAPRGARTRGRSPRPRPPGNSRLAPRW